MFQMKRDSRAGFGSIGDSSVYFEDRKEALRSIEEKNKVYFEDFKEALRSIEEKKKKNAIPGSLRKLVRY